MISSFADRDTERLSDGIRVKKFISFEVTARRKLAQLHAAGKLSDLKLPPGNHLEKLQGARDGQWSIRINDRWRICFEWAETGPTNVEIVDYH